MGLSTVIETLPLGELTPDARNPRLPLSQRDGLIGDDLIVDLANRFDPLVVAESIARHGYFGSEPLIVCREADKWVVLEGNRRLTALLGLARPELRARFKDADKWEELEQVDPIVLDRPIPVLKAETRDDADAVIGFRHIGQAMAWKPLQRAQFIAHLVDDRGISFSEVSDTVGEDEDNVRMLYRNQKILLEASAFGASEIFDLGQARFGTYTAALNRTGLREYVSAPGIREVAESAPILSEDSLPRLEDLFGWLYGLGERPKVIRETRELTMLAEVVKRPAALEELGRTHDLDTAYALTSAPNKGLARQLAMAVGHLRAAVNSVELLLDDPRTQERADELSELAEQLQQALIGGVTAELDDE